MAAVEQRTYNVSGMSCAHCVAAVGETVGELPGVSGVDVDLASGDVVVTGSAIDGGAVRAAVQEAGYELAERA